MLPLCLLLFVPTLYAQDPSGEDRTSAPNIVLILADDLGYGDPGCYSTESKIPTPRIDALAAEGRLFTDAHSPSSVCTPTRYGLLTGRYAWRTALKKSVLWPWDPPLLEDERTTLAELCADRGYATACIGKWHLGWDWPLDDDLYLTEVFDGHTLVAKRRAEIAARIDWNRPLRGGPLDHGFGVYFGDDVPNFPPYSFFEGDRIPLRPTAEKPGAMFGHAGPASPGWDLATVLPAIAARAGSWIDERAEEPERPFFLYLPLTAPHTPIAPTPAHVGRSEAGAYGDWVCEVDWTVGVVLDALERGGLTRDTLVLFTSDNGSPARNGEGMSGPVGSVRTDFGHDPSHPWRGLKSDAWEGGHRVPFVLRWPAEVAPGGRCDQPLVLTDLYASLARIAGAEPPEGEGEDSFDQRRNLIGELPGEPLRDHLVHHSGQGVFALREGPWKLILGKGSGGFSRVKVGPEAPEGQLYHLGEDPGEEDNRYAERPEVVARLRARLKEIQDSGRSAPTSAD